MALRSTLIELNKQSLDPQGSCVELLRLAQEMGRVQVLVGSHMQDRPPLLGHADSAIREIRLQAARHFSFG